MFSLQFGVRHAELQSIICALGYARKHWNGARHLAGATDLDAVSIPPHNKEWRAGVRYAVNRVMIVYLLKLAASQSSTLPSAFWPVLSGMNPGALPHGASIMIHVHRAGGNRRPSSASRF